MKIINSLLLTAIVVSSVFTTTAMANASKGKKVYLKKLKVCKKDGLRNGGIFAAKHSRREWASIKKSDKLKEEWKSICAHGTKKIDKMKSKDVKNLYDFIWKYASDGDTATCG